jgi:hypothetical protein
VSNSISKKEYDIPGLRFQERFEEGIRLVQKYSGKIWTDYNYHDPGVTILEYLVYALMDLSYRTNMPVKDLFFLGVDGHDPVRQNLLIPPEDIFPTEPYTMADYRRMIIDRVRRVKNAWVNPIRDDQGGHQGLLEIQVQSRDELSEAELEQLRTEITDLFHAHRNLGCDLGRLIMLKAVPLTISGTVHLEVDAIGEFVLSRIYAELEAYINPEVRFRNPYDLLEEGMPADEVFSGPRAQHGLILKEDLRPKSDSIHVSRMRDLMARIPGVKAVLEFKVYRDGLPVHEDQINFSAASYPVIEFNAYDERNTPGIRIMKNNVEIEVDPVTTRQLLDFDLASRRSQYLGSIQYRNTLPRGRFTVEELGRHYAMHNEFPAIYGLGRYSQVQKSDADERKAQARQLRTYLTFFEQIMANHLAQLTNIRHLLSINSDHPDTYFTLLPEDIPGWEELLVRDRGSHAMQLQSMINEAGENLQRRNRVLDHLMARFSEHIQTEALRKNALHDPGVDRIQVERDIIEGKIRFLQHVTELSTARNKAFNYRSAEGWDSTNISTLERKLALLLDIRDHRRRSLSRPLLSWVGMEPAAEGQDTPWFMDQLLLDGDQRIQILRLLHTDYEDGSIRFPRQGISFIKRLFANIRNQRFLRQIISGRDGQHRHHVLMKIPDPATDVVVFEHDEAAVCQSVLERFKQSVIQVDLESEGFHMLEHILLRPLEPALFTFNILDEQGEIYLSGYFPGSMEAQRLQSEEIPLLGMIPERFSIQSDEEGQLFSVILYDGDSQPVARLKKIFKSRTAAQRALLAASRYLSRIQAREVSLAQVLEITVQDDVRGTEAEPFHYSNALSFLLPAWPARFQNEEFIGLFRRLLQENIPAHFSADIYLLDPLQMSIFEDVYSRWLHVRAQSRSDFRELDLLSRQLIQTLGRFKSSRRRI